MTPRPLRRAALVLPLAGAVLAAGGTAWALARADATGTQPVSTLSFGAQPSLSAGSGQAGPLKLVYTGTDAASRTFFVRNTGSAALTSQTWSLSLVDDGTGGTKGTASLYVCSGTYTGTSCGGTERLVVQDGQNNLATTAASGVALPVGGALSARFAPGASRGFTATVEVTVSRAQALPTARTSTS